MKKGNKKCVVCEHPLSAHTKKGCQCKDEDGGDCCCANGIDGLIE